jgi:hypothetical protein
MCCEDEKKVSEDIRVIHDELEKADTWIFAAQEILRPENEEFDPDPKDIGNIEVALTFAIENIKEAITLCQIYRGSREEPVKEDHKENDYETLGGLLEPKLSSFKQKIINEFVKIKTDTGTIYYPCPTDAEGKPVDFTFNEARLREAKETLLDLENKMEFLKANRNIERIRLTPEEFKLYKDR